MLSNSLESIGEGAFGYCPSLTSVEIPGSVSSIGSRAFQNCLGLTNIKIPEIAYIRDETFSGCSNLVDVTMPECIRSIGNKAFNSCSSLVSIDIPDSVYEIGQRAFYGCETLSSLVIPNQVKIIGDEAFRKCYGLTRIVLPSSVNSMGEKVFSYCSAVTDVYVNWNTPLEINENVFSHIDLSQVTLHVPARTTDLYKKDYVWSLFGNIVEDASAIEEVTSTDVDSNSSLFNLAGQRVSAPQKGQIYISEGRKKLAK